MPRRVLIWLIPFLCLCLPSKTSAEGTKQLSPDSTYACDLWATDGVGNRNCFASINCGPDQRLYIHIASASEKIYMGFRGSIVPLTVNIRLNQNLVYSENVNNYAGAPGRIFYHAQAVAGPKFLDPHGYDPLTFVPGQPGDYSIDFTIPLGLNEVAIRYFDITVIDTVQNPNTPIDGRLWSKDWGFHTGDCTVPTHAMIATQYIYSDDSIVTSLNYNKMRGWNFDITSTRNGCFMPPVPWETSCLSQYGNHHYAEYKIFINDPDSLEYPTGTMGMILGDSISTIKYCDGSMDFSFQVSKPGEIQLIIESNLSPGIQEEDLFEKYPVNQGANTIHWDGLNALGMEVPCGDSVSVSMTYINGLTNIALYDVETHPDGFIIEQVRPPGPPIATYWNDTLLASLGGEMQLSGCYPVLPDSGCHRWIGNVNAGIGSLNTINTWWYAGSSQIDLGLLDIECTPHTPQNINGPITPCFRPLPVYRVEPNPLPGGDSRGYEWVLTDQTGTVLFDSLNMPDSITIDFSCYPAGSKYLKVRGNSVLCGIGPFGPDSNNGKGILINPTPSPQTTNTTTSFFLCSGDATNILLEADLPGTSFSYTAIASSPNITGYTAGTTNPIAQQLFNTGQTLDSVTYLVVPFNNPCAGDTTRFVVKVSPLDVMICNILPSASPVCEGASVTLSIDPPVVDSTAQYEWFVNQIITGSNQPVFTFFPDAGDSVSCTITSVLFCTPNHQANTNPFMINLEPIVQPSVTITPSASPACEGDTLILFTTSVNQGADPLFHWWLNGLDPGIDSSIFSYIPVNGDEVVCQMSSSLTCITDSLVTDSLIVAVQGPSSILDTLVCYGTSYYAEGAFQTEPGTYHDTLNPPVDCIHYLTTNLQYQPEIPVDLGSDQPLCKPPLVLDAFCQGASYLWQDSSTNATFPANEPGIYYVRVELNGCSQTDSILLSPCESVPLWIPNAFSPNGDGRNDVFRPVGEIVSGYSMIIFNRWGEQLFFTTDQTTGWDGTTKGSLCPTDSYIYKITYETPAGNPQALTGTFTLIH
jgi:gliding motility-associated-like protein